MRPGNVCTPSIKASVYVERRSTYMFSTQREASNAWDAFGGFHMSRTGKRSYASDDYYSDHDQNYYAVFLALGGRGYAAPGFGSVGLTWSMSTSHPQDDVYQLLQGMKFKGPPQQKTWADSRNVVANKGYKAPHVPRVGHKINYTR